MLFVNRSSAIRYPGSDATLSTRETGRLFRHLLSVDAKRTVLLSLLVACGYYAGNKVGFFLTPTASPIATYWPANAILLASLLLVVPRRWWVILLAVLGAHLFAQMQRGVPFSTALGWYVSNTGEAVLGAVLLYRSNRKKLLFNSVRGTLLFLLVGVFLPPFITSFFDAAVVVITRWGIDYWMLWMTRLFSNMLAVLTIVPAMLSFGSGGIRRVLEFTLLRRLEALLLFAAIVSVTVFVYGGSDLLRNAFPALVYVPLPFLIWSALRFGAAGLGTSVSILAFIAFHYVTQGRGPFASLSMTENVLFLQLLLSVVTVPLLLLNAVLWEHGRTESKLQDSTGKLIHAQEQERRRIARELHDDIGQQLSLVELDLRRLRNSIDDGLPASGLKEPLEHLVRQVNAIGEGTRNLSHGLHPIQLEYLGIVPVLKIYCRDIENRTSIKVSLREPDAPVDLQPETALCFFRIAQEALHNVVKHSRASSVQVELKTGRNQVVLWVADDGVGFASEQERAAGLGLVSMQERMQSIGGTVKITSTPFKGTIVEAASPLNLRSASHE